MAWARILALLDGAESDASVTATSLAIGKAFTATVDGLIVRPDPREAVRLAIDGMSPAMIEGVIDAARDESQRRIARARECFETACAEAGDFTMAVGWQKKAIELIPDDVTQAKEDMRTRLALYQAKKPYRDDPTKRAGEERM